MQSEVYEYFCDKELSKNTQILVVSDDKEAALAHDAATFAGRFCFVLPDFRAQKGDDLRTFSQELIDISSSLSKFHKNIELNPLIISPISTILKPLPDARNLSLLELKFAQQIELNLIKDTLIRHGYSVVDIVQSPAEVSFRGEIIDIFVVGREFPYRVLLDDDMVESIREFDPSTQKSDPKEIDSIEIVPFLASLSLAEFEEANENLSNLQSDAFVSDLNSLGFWAISGFCDYLSKYESIGVREFSAEEFFDDTRDFYIKTLPSSKKFKDLQTTPNKEFFEFNRNKKIVVLARNEALFESLDLSGFTNISLEISPLILNLSSKDELIVSLNKPSPKRRLKKPSIVIDELQNGDFVVHEEYGIGKFAGLELIEILGVKKEFVSLIYQNDDKLLLPVEYLNKIDRYIGGALVMVDRLGKGSFARIKERVKAKLFEIASKIIALAAKRELIRGCVIRNSHEDYAKFLSDANFEYTPDQNRAVEEIFEDLSSSKVMDRLLSGDVGFGKTEVAMNAIFATVKCGFQALFFVPTTLLSSQHFITLEGRFKKFGIKVQRYDRFTASKDKIKIKNSLENGEAMVVIGTHALLGLKASNLALVIIDEEHKFGVKQKERLKDISQNSHILSMSATPIPRSLNMALSSIKSYSVLNEAPKDRQDVRSVVKEYDEKIIKEAILRELRRGGQLFYIHNHIASMELAKKELLRIVPNLRILILHSQIEAKTTEDEIIKFGEGGYDLMLCTSIVESGIHMPRVNTIIIEDANKFGMADLHQLRGRVGRSAVQGFCYFLVKDKSTLSSDGIKRLVALESNSFLGSGSVLAYHDLEIRGGGNLVGEAQSGHIEMIGYSLYLRMLENEINLLMNKEPKDSGEVEIKLSVNAFINPDFIREDRLRLELYRRLSRAKSVGEVYDISGEIQDRFGKSDIYTKQFIDIIIIKVLSNSLGIKSLTNYEQLITITSKDNTKVTLKSKSKDDDDILAEILIYLRKESR